MSDSHTKRRRLVLSCFECKRRKLKCGRETPICSRCISVGTPELCQYDSRYSMNTDSNVVGQDWSTSSSTTQSSTAAFDNIDLSNIPDPFPSSLWLPFQLPGIDLEGSGSDALDNDSLLGSLESSNTRYSLSDLGTSSNGQFRGSSHSTNILASAPELCAFMKQAVEEHHILGSPQWATIPRTTEMPLPYYSKKEIDQVISRLMPSEECCRTLLGAYFNHFSGIYAVVHVPSFWIEYQDLQDGTHSDMVRFKATLLAMMSCARCLYVEDPLSFDGDSSTARNEALAWLHAVESWLVYRKDGGGLIEQFQIRCLVLLSRKLNDIGREGFYTASQTLLADAISNGLHRNWKELGIDEPLYERELRRRIWTVVLELDLLACTERGVPSMASGLFSDLGPRKNYNDLDYNAGTLIEPSEKPDDELTDGTYAKIPDSIRAVRYEILDLVNNPQKIGSLHQQRLIALRAQVTEALDRVPEWPDLVKDTPNQRPCPISRAALELNLHEAILLLHIPFALRKDANSCSALDTEFQRFICVRSASTILRVYEMVMERGCSVIALGISGILRAGLCLCLMDGDSGDIPNYGKWQHGVKLP